MDKLNILWLTDNRDTVFNMLTMYAINSLSKGWWKTVNVIIWGASAKLVAEDRQVQTEVLEMIRHGVTVEACRDCCENLGVCDELIRLGISVKYMGDPLTEYIKAGEKVMSV